MISVGEQIAKISQLGRNWDSYDAEAPDERCLKFARIFLGILRDSFRLPEPKLVPTRVGGIMALWYSPASDFEIEIEIQDATAVVS